MNKSILVSYLSSYNKPNYFFIFITFFYFLNNSIFSLNENVSIYIYISFFLLMNSIQKEFQIYTISYNKKKITILLLLISPAIFFTISRFNVGISFRGDEIAHYSNSITNLSYWFTPQNNSTGLLNFINKSTFSIIEILNLKIINLFIFVVINFLFYFFCKKLFNLSLFLSTLFIIFYQKSFPYEYSQGIFLVDNFTQIFFYLFFPFSFSETLGFTNFIFYVIYLSILRPLINDEGLNFRDLKIFCFIFFFPYFNLLLFSNYQEGIAIIFVILAIENFYKYFDFKKASILFALAGCFREVFFLPIIILLIFDIYNNKKKIIKNIKFYFFIFTPLIFHLLHINNNVFGKNKTDFIYKISEFSLNDLNFNSTILIKFLFILIPAVISIYLFIKKKDLKFIILYLLNSPIILILILRNNLTFVEIDRFFYLWILIFYFYIFIYISKFYLPKFLLILSTVIILFNNYNFFYKYLNFELDIEPNKKLFLPIKKILIDENQNKNLIINSSINLNKFDQILYPNIDNVVFNKMTNGKFNCICDNNTMNVFLTDNLNDLENICSLKENKCNKKLSFSNQLYYIEVFD
tara:strand:+ start:662 stop:2398 length:1737 start_codon:yes stop_codon:yes gene_type:complete